jgi:hypothetical protein
MDSPCKACDGKRPGTPAQASQLGSQQAGADLKGGEKTENLAIGRLAKGRARHQRERMTAKSAAPSLDVPRLATRPERYRFASIGHQIALRTNSGYPTDYEKMPGNRRHNCPIWSLADQQRQPPGTKNYGRHTTHIPHADMPCRPLRGPCTIPKCISEWSAKTWHATCLHPSRASWS